MALILQLLEGALHGLGLVAMGDHDRIILDDDDKVLDADQHGQRPGGLDVVVAAVDSATSPLEALPASSLGEAA